jgi:hypothetical protein
MPWKLPLTYLPLTLLAYLPAVALRFDPRWVSVVCELAAAAIVVRAAGAHRRAALDHPIYLLLASWYVLSSSVEWLRITTAPPTWAALALMIATAGERRRSAVAVGLAVATTPLAAVFVPFVALLWLRRGLGSATRTALLALGVAAACILPFVLWAPRPFFEGTILWFNDLQRYPGIRWDMSRTWAEYAGLAGLFWEHGLQRWLKPLQALALGAVVIVYWRRGSPPEGFAAFCTAGFLAFMVCNPVIWPYYYAPAVIAGLLAAGAATKCFPSETRL